MKSEAKGKISRNETALPRGTAYYGKLLQDIKARIRGAQLKAAVKVNSELLMLYWDIGGMLIKRQQAEGWGTGVLKRLSKDLNNTFSELKGFSERNLKLMTQFNREYPDLGKKRQRSVAQIETDGTKGQQPVALSGALSAGKSDDSGELGKLVCSLSWSVNILLIQKIKDITDRKWYMQQCLEHGWGRDTLAAMVKKNARERQGTAITNFENRLPAPHSEMAAGLLKDPYIFDFMTLEEPFHERELETGLIGHLEKFLLELGQGFSFVGRQYHLELNEKDFYIDLLFYHLKLRCFVVIDLKKGDFKPEYAGKMNFYCSVVDEYLKHKTDQPTIGLILCQSKDKIVAEYALRDINKPIGVSDYELTRALPEEMESSLPSIEAIEAELSREESG